MAGALLVAAPASGAVTAAAADDVPILGQAFTMGTVGSGEPAVFSVHGVRRVDGATIVYWSLALHDEVDPSGGARFGGGWKTFSDKNLGPNTGDIGLIDVVGERAYRPLAHPDGGTVCVCAPTFLGNLKPGEALVAWSAVTELPPEVTTVSVSIAEQVIPGVPVEDGPMLPAVTGDGPLVLGMGWPEPDPQLLATAKDRDPAFYQLTTRVSDLERTVTTSTGEVALAADVLFAKDSATLSGKGSTTVDAAARQIKDADADSALTVTGHADSDGADAYNQALSERRAKAVAAALSKTLGPGYLITAVGKGESQPIASNSTPEGKTKNRRVSITFTEGQ